MAAKAILREKFTATQTYHKKKKLQINNPTLYINELEKTNQTKSKVNRRKETIKIRAGIKEIKTLKKQIEKITETKICFFEK